MLILAIELINLIGRRLSFNLTSNSHNVLRIILLLNVSNSLPQLPISLSIQLVSPYEHWPCFLSGVKKDQVSRHSFIVMHLNEWPDSQGLGGGRFPDLFLDVVRWVLFQIDGSVSLQSRYVVKSFLHHCNGQHECQGSNEGKQEPNSKSFDELRESDEKEEEIKKESELVVKHKRDKRNDAVLLVIEFVRRVPGGASIPPKTQDSILMHRPCRTTPSLLLLLLSGIKLRSGLGVILEFLVFSFLLAFLLFVLVA
jgi:hypothetical protein